MSPDYLVKTNTLSTINNYKLTRGQDLYLPNVVIANSEGVVQGHFALRQ